MEWLANGHNRLLLQGGMAVPIRYENAVGAQCIWPQGQVEHQAAYVAQFFQRVGQRGFLHRA